MKFSLSATTTAILGFIGTTNAFAPSFQQQRNVISTSTELYERKPFITGNWKLNPMTKGEAIALATDIVRTMNDDSPEVAVFVPFPFIQSVQTVVGDKISIGAEAVTPEDSGAFTGGISAQMLNSIGVKWALAGHSERRTINAESDENINAQCIKIINNDMNVILCIGESLSEFEKDLAGDICEIQLKKGLKDIPNDIISSGRVAIAYEPVWAIGTGKVATPEIAQDVHAKCRSILADMYGDAIADEIRILYGGSVSPESVDGLLAKPDIDGALVGGASLNGEGFGRIINFQPVEELQTV